MKTNKWGLMAVFCGVFLFSCAVGSTGAEARGSHWGFSLGHGGAGFHYGGGHHGYHGYYGGHHGYGGYGGHYGYSSYRPRYYGYHYTPRRYHQSYHYSPSYSYGGCGFY